jgi:hypothetical protein
VALSTKGEIVDIVIALVARAPLGGLMKELWGFLTEPVLDLTQLRFREQITVLSG